MPGKKDAAWWREYRRKQKEERQAHAGVATPRETPVSDTKDMSHRGEPVEIVRLPADATPAQVAAVKDDWKKKLLTAPDDDCAACGHDRQTYHLNAGGVCWAPAPNTRSRRCDCPTYVSAAEPF